MKKIMFNDKYGLTQAVLDGRKTMTRRIIKEGVIDDTLMETMCYRVAHEREVIRNLSRYQVDDIVAIAQNYKDIVSQASNSFNLKENLTKGLKDTAGWNNKMFVKANLMPNHIRITNIRVERLQDISDEDCLREGIHRERFGDSIQYKYKGGRLCYSPKIAFELLIDKVSGKGIWESNPFVFVYEFELVD